MEHDSPFSRFLVKEWPTEFAQTRRPRDDRPYLEGLLAAVRASYVELDPDGSGSSRKELRIGVEPDGDDAQLFMEAYVDGMTSLDIRSAIRFLQTIKGRKLHDQISTKRRGTGWLDDRTYDQTLPQESSQSTTNSVAAERDVTDALIIPVQNLQLAEPQTDVQASPSQRPRSYPAPLSAADLYSFLREKQFDHDEYLDADRRLVYIADPDAYDFTALVRTARPHQHLALRDAIRRHLALSTSIRTFIRQGYSEYQLEFHIPYFAMRRINIVKGIVQAAKRAHRGWMNISFLDTKDTNPETVGVCGVYQAHITVTLGGTDNTRWFAYCFEDRYFDKDWEFSPDDQTAAHQADQVARCEFGAETPIWNPREYFLRVLLIRICQVRREWKELICFMETGIKEHSWGRSLFAAARDGTPQVIGDATASTRLDHTSQLLSTLLEELSKTNAAWTRFISTTGDLAYFLDTKPNPHMIKTFCQLKEAFEDLHEFETYMQRMAEQCEKRAQAINLRIASENKRSVDLAVYYISPFAIVSTFFAIPVPIISFDRNLVSFLVTMLVYMVVLQALLFLCGGALRRQQWWRKLLRRVKANVRGDGYLTVRKGKAIVLGRRQNRSPVD